MFQRLLALDITNGIVKATNSYAVNTRDDYGSLSIQMISGDTSDAYFTGDITEKESMKSIRERMNI